VTAASHTDLIRAKEYSTFPYECDIINEIYGKCHLTFPLPSSARYTKRKKNEFKEKSDVTYYRI
jgi:hypothetical protein